MREKRGYRDLYKRELDSVTSHCALRGSDSAARQLTCSQDRILRRSLLLAPHRLGIALLPLLPHAAPAVPTPLPPLALLFRPLLLRRVRLHHLECPTASQVTGCCGGARAGDLVVCVLQPSDVCGTLDKGAM